MENVDDANHEAENDPLWNHGTYLTKTPGLGSILLSASSQEPTPGTVYRSRRKTSLASNLEILFALKYALVSMERTQFRFGWTRQAVSFARCKTTLSWKCFITKHSSTTTSTLPKDRWTLSRDEGLPYLAQELLLDHNGGVMLRNPPMMLGKCVVPQ